MKAFFLIIMPIVWVFFLYFFFRWQCTNVWKMEGLNFCRLMLTLLYLFYVFVPPSATTTCMAKSYDKTDSLVLVRHWLMSLSNCTMGCEVGYEWLTKHISFWRDTGLEVAIKAWTYVAMYSDTATVFQLLLNQVDWQTWHKLWIVNSGIPVSWHEIKKSLSKMQNHNLAHPP